MELKQPGKVIPAKDVDILRLIDTSYLYGLINDGINKYNDRNTIQGFINNMVGNTNTATVVKNSNNMTMVSKSGKAKPIVVHENNNGAMKLTETGMKSNNTLGAHIVDTSTNKNEPGSSHTFTGNNSIFKLTKIKHSGESKKES